MKSVLVQLGLCAHANSAADTKACWVTTESWEALVKHNIYHS